MSASFIPSAPCQPETSSTVEVSIIRHQAQPDGIDESNRDSITSQMQMPLVGKGNELQPSSDQLIRIFDGLFDTSEQTVLVGGGQEPLYQPANAHHSVHQIIFTRDYLSSALHEIAHWCIAGTARRLLLDYGYWYAPDGRTAEQQSQFAQVEVKPQALEWILTEACGHQFNISQDNLNGDICPVQQQKFKQDVVQQADNYLENGLPQRAHILNQALLDYYHRREEFGRHLFTLARL